MTWFRDPVWQFFGVIVALFSLGVTIWPYFRQRHLAALQYRVVQTPLLTQPLWSDNQIEVKSGKYQFVRPYKIDVNVSNAGHVPIRRDDFENRLSVICIPATYIVGTQIIDAQPPELVENLSMENHGDRIIISPCLLNPGDWFNLSFLVDNPQDIRLTGRIVGVKSIERTSIRKFSSILRETNSQITEVRARQARSRLWTLVLLNGLIVWFLLIRPWFPAFAESVESVLLSLVVLILDLVQMGLNILDPVVKTTN